MRKEAPMTQFPQGSQDRHNSPGTVVGESADEADRPSAVQTSLQGGLLIAMPALQDPNFRRSVTLILSHSEEGALGIVLGPPTATPITDVCSQFHVRWSRPDTTHIRSGGPCENSRIWLLHGGTTPL